MQNASCAFLVLKNQANNLHKDFYEIIIFQKSQARGRKDPAVARQETVARNTNLDTKFYPPPPVLTPARSRLVYF